MPKICPSCGRQENDENVFMGQFCSKCTMKKSEIEIPKITINICKDCGKVRQTEWMQIDWRAIEDKVIKKIKGDFIDYEKLNKISWEEQRLKVKLIFKKDPEISKKVEIPIKINKTLCSDCLKSRSHYYNATIQVRGENNEKIKARIVGAITQNDPTQLTKMTQLKKGLGWDIFVREKDFARQILSKLKYKPSCSRKLQSERDGKRLYRIILCVRD